MTMSTLHTITTHKKYRELLAEWAADNTEDSDQDKSGSLIPNATVLVAFRTRPPIDGEVELFDAPLDDEETDDEEERVNDANHDHGPRAKKQPPAPQPVSKIPAQRPPEEFMCGITARSRRMVVHVPNMTWKGAGLLHQSYPADVCFGPDATNEEVYEQTVKTPGLIDLAVQGGVACVLAYGQTSAGKTYSMMGLELAISQDLFSLLPVDDTGKTQFEVHVTFLELLGNKPRDLMRADEAGKNIEIREADTGNVHPVLQSTQVDSAKELEDVIVRCLGHRRTAQTSRNAKSSRSHAILTILLKNKTPGGAVSEIILVDLAGSERHADSKKHSAARFQETRDNNKSLLALKDCVRAHVSGAALVPFRTSKLTLLLKPIFDRKASRPTRTVVIAHVSPHIQDAEHSANTLRYVSQFKAIR
ncbi:Kinesin-like protein [Mycena sanguinolenta]|uniref:Kinesin-like protein n=1 Tax=Mycena sanguinolenta TaxID=230812 RepID=A0A8H6Z0B3_9AGAR|nr:Kinesin-like protein [Mycena sanguinolenta]